MTVFFDFILPVRFMFSVCCCSFVCFVLCLCNISLTDDKRDSSQSMRNSRWMRFSWIVIELANHIHESDRAPCQRQLRYRTLAPRGQERFSEQGIFVGPPNYLNIKSAYSDFFMCCFLLYIVARRPNRPIPNFEHNGFRGFAKITVSYRRVGTSGVASTLLLK